MTKNRKGPANRTGARRGDSKAPPTNAWKPGQSGNPDGRPKTDPELVEAFRARTPRALATLDKAMADYASNATTEKGDPLVPAAAAVKAAEVVLNRGWGTAPSTIKLDVDAKVKSEVTHDVKPIADPQRIARIVQVLQQAGALSAGSGGQGTDAVEEQNNPKEES